MALDDDHPVEGPEPPDRLDEALPFSMDAPAAAELPPDDAHYGPDIATEAELRLLGPLEGRRVLELGCGAGRSSVAFAKHGAMAVAVDPSTTQLNHARRLSEREEVRVALHHGEVADLAFLRADSIDVVFSSYALARVDDLNRLFRQVHRVLKPEGPLVFSLPHPAFVMLGPSSADTPPLVARSYFDRSAIAGSAVAGPEPPAHPHTIAELFTSLTRANFRVDALLEPEPVPAGPRSIFWNEAMRWVPPTLVLRARKEGS